MAFEFRNLPLGQRKTQAERLMDEDGNPLSLCPFGCKQEDCDETGLCKHFVGATNDGVMMEPRKQRPFYRINEETGDREAYPSGYYFLDGQHPVPVPKEARLVQITQSARVYTEAGMEDYQPSPKADAVKAALEQSKKAKAS